MASLQQERHTGADSVLTEAGSGQRIQLKLGVENDVRGDRALKTGEGAIACPYTRRIR